MVLEILATFVSTGTKRNLMAKHTDTRACAAGEMFDDFFQLARLVGPLSIVESSPLATKNTHSWVAHLSRSKAFE